MGLLDKLGATKPMTPDARLQQVISMAQSNYTTILKQRGLTIPEGMTDPQQISNYLVNSGQVPQSRLAWALQKLGWR